MNSKEPGLLRVKVRQGGDAFVMAVSVVSDDQVTVKDVCNLPLQIGDSDLLQRSRCHTTACR